MPNQKTRMRRRRKRAAETEAAKMLQGAGGVSERSGAIQDMGAVITTQKPLRFGDFPEDIVFHIFSLLQGRDLDSDHMALSLGLTCSSLYQIMKVFYPDPIKLDRYCWWSAKPSIHITEIVGGFLGREKYKWLGHGLFKFGTVELYENRRDIEDLKDRYSDFQCLKWIPSPYNMGDYWYVETFELLQCYSDWPQKWKNELRLWRTCRSLRIVDRMATDLGIVETSESLGLDKEERPKTE